MTSVAPKRISVPQGVLNKYLILVMRMIEIIMMIVITCGDTLNFRAHLRAEVNKSQKSRW